MNQIGVWARLVLAILATWRVTHALVREDGPADVFVRVRKRLGATLLGRLMDCFHCASLWVAAPFTFFVIREPAGWVVAWFAVSGAACLLERIGSETLVVEQPPSLAEGEHDHGMLRSETSSALKDGRDVDAKHVPRK